jgi:hypothetical protein
MTELPAIDTAVLLRVRQHIIDYLELASSFDAQRNYQQLAGTSNVASEVLHQWEDWMTEQWQHRYTAPAFSADEREAMMRYEQVLRPLTSGSVDTAQDLQQLQTMNLHWQALRAAAAELLAVFRVRGVKPVVDDGA